MFPGLPNYIMFKHVFCVPHKKIKKSRQKNTKNTLVGIIITNVWEKMFQTTKQSLITINQHH